MKILHVPNHHFCNVKHRSIKLILLESGAEANIDQVNWKMIFLNCACIGELHMMERLCISIIG